MMNENVINEMKEEVNAIIEYAHDQFGEYLTFDLNGFYFDRPHTSFTADIDAFGFELQLVYVFEEDCIYLYDVNRKKDIFKTPNTDVDLYDVCQCLYDYALVLHRADSTNCIEFL